jgi:hypothetical protein
MEVLEEDEVEILDEQAKVFRDEEESHVGLKGMILLSHHIVTYMFISLDGSRHLTHLRVISHHRSDLKSDGGIAHHIPGK